MSFTASHYITVAEILRTVRARYVGTHGATATREVQSELCAMFGRHNPRFDAERFNKQCEPKGD